MGLRDGVSEWISEDEVCGFVAALLDAGASLNARDDFPGSTPLGWACRWGRAKVARFLIERGADPLEADAEPWASSHAWAVTRQQIAVLHVLREYSA
jgi:ankyrin repeat protein